MNKVDCLLIPTKEIIQGLDQLNDSEFDGLVPLGNSMFTLNSDQLFVPKLISVILKSEFIIDTKSLNYGINS